MTGCYTCEHLRRATESWEMPHIWWWECMARPQNESLKGFPWKQTKCKYKLNRLPPLTADEAFARDMEATDG